MEVVTVELSVAEAEAWAGAFVRAIHKARPLPDRQLEFTPAQRAAVAVFLGTNDATTLAQHRVCCRKAYALLKERMGLRMSRAAFILAVKMEFGRTSWAKK